MRRAAQRYSAFVVALAASWFVLLLWAAGSDWRAPWTPDNERVLAGSRFHAVFGVAAPDGQRLRVTSPAADFSALQSTELPELRAADFPLLRYRFADFPRTLELSLVFRSTEQPDDVQTIALPWPGGATSTFDLSHVAAWRGHIIEMGFAQFAAAQNVPPPLGFQPFDLVSAQLWSPSWRGDLAALATDWLGAWPWSQRSVHALGREGHVPRTQSVVLCAALGAAIAVGWGALLLGLRGRRLLTTALVCMALAWFALDLRWQSGLVQRLLATRTVYAGVDAAARAGLVGDSELQQAADDVRALIRGEPAQTRILVHAGGAYQWLRLMWHLLPLNVGALSVAAPVSTAIPDGCLIVFYDSDAWQRNAVWRRLLAHSERMYPSAAVMANGFEEDPVVVFRYRHDD